MITFLFAKQKLTPNFDKNFLSLKFEPFISSCTYFNVRINLYRTTKTWQLERQNWPFESPKKDVSCSARDRRLSSWCLEVSMHFMVYMHSLAFFILRTGFTIIYAATPNNVFIYLLLYKLALLSCHKMIVSNINCKMRFDSNSLA